ncbi:MAG TPA: AmmeMemoRadiSam system protein B [Polyangiaceae bacterium]
MVDARKPAAAGVFYPAERELLARTVRDLLDAVPPSRNTGRAARLRAIVVPHGVSGPSGAVAATAWARVAAHAARFRRVVLLGPAHHTQFIGIAAPFADTFATPLGAVEVDRIAIEVVRRFPHLIVSDDPHEQEPSLEVQLPFVQTLLPNATIVPLLVGDIDDLDAAEVLDTLWVDDTLLVVSTDLSHYYDAVTAKRLDEATARSVETLDAGSIGEEQACGHAALRGLLTAARARKLKATRLDVRHSGEVSGELAEVVGYGSFMVG